MKATATIRGWMEIPRKGLGKSRLASIKRRLTIHPVWFDKKRPKPEPVKNYRLSKLTLKVPINWGLEEFPEMAINDQTVEGGRLTYKTLPDPNHPSAPEGQAEFMNDMLETAKSFFATLAVGDTGVGKTAVALRTAALLGRRAIVLVDTEQLLIQWIEAIQKHLGIARSEIGIVRQDKCEYRGKSICVGLVQSLIARVYPKEFYRAFGTAIYDEVHTCGARRFSESMGLFPARYKLALTATPERKDGCAPLFLNYFGTGDAMSVGTAMPCDCKVITYEHDPRERFSNSRPYLLGQLAAHEGRNNWLASRIAEQYRKGGNILVIGDRVVHLEVLMAKCNKLHHIPVSELGQFTAEKTTGVAISYVPVGARPKVGETYTIFTKRTGARIKNGARVGLVSNNKDGTATVQDKEGRHHQVDRKHLRKRMLTPKRTKMTQAELDTTKRHARIIFATYGMMQKGQDVPRLDRGFDITPRATGTQMIGRIRRRMAGKGKPVWFTIYDKGIAKAERWAQARIREFRKTNVEVVWENQK